MRLGRRRTVVPTPFGDGTLVGLHAVDAEGALTHPGTSTHAHLVWRDDASGNRLTGHVERAGLAPDAVVKLPASDITGDRP